MNLIPILFKFFALFCNMQISMLPHYEVQCNCVAETCNCDGHKL